MAKLNETVKSNKVLAKVAHFYAGVELMGSQMTISNRNSEIEVTPIGLKIKSKKNKRVILVPWSNIKGVEMIPEPEGSEN